MFLPLLTQIRRYAWLSSTKCWWVLDNGSYRKLRLFLWGNGSNESSTHSMDFLTAQLLNCNLACRFMRIGCWLQGFRFWAMKVWHPRRTWNSFNWHGCETSSRRHLCFASKLHSKFPDSILGYLWVFLQMVCTSTYVCVPEGLALQNISILNVIRSESFLYVYFKPQEIGGLDGQINGIRVGWPPTFSEDKVCMQTTLTPLKHHFNLFLIRIVKGGNYKRSSACIVDWLRRITRDGHTLSPWTGKHKSGR